MKNIIYKSLYCLLITSICLFVACSDDDDPFAGTDNFVTAFTLKQGDKDYHAVISGNDITVNVPDGISLNGATASIQLSENASIYPNPKSIKEWDDEILFAVKSYNGQSVKYKYTINRTAISSEGSIVLETQAEVDAFASWNITSIEGNLIIGRTSGLDSIKNLSPLGNIKSIGYSLIINTTFAGKSLEGFDGLKNVGGSIQVNGVSFVESVTFPSLETVGGMYFKNAVLGKLAFNKLTNIAQSLDIYAPLGEISFPNLKYIGGNLVINDRNAMLRIASFPSLQKVGTIQIVSMPSLTKIQFGELKEVENMHLTPLPVLNFLDVPKLESATGTITLPAVSKLVEASFPELSKANSIIVDGKEVSRVDFPKLTSINKLSLQNIAVAEIASGFPKLETVEEELKFQDLAKMKKLAVPNTIKKIKKLTIYTYSTTPYAEIDVRGLNIEELSVQREAVNGVTIIGDDVFNGTLSIEGDNAKSYNLSFPKLVGFSEVDSLYLGSYVSNVTSMDIKGIKKIIKGFYIPNNNILQFSLPDLEEVGGNFIINHLNNIQDEKITKITVPNLKTIGGDFTVTINSRTVKNLEFSSLQSVGKNFALATGTAATASWDQDRDLAVLSFPKLKSVGGEMIIAPELSNANTSNKNLKNLDGFSSLTNVKSISILRNKQLNSYQGLSKVVPVLSEGTWNAKDNGYNPSYKDLEAGRFVKP